MQFCAFSCDLVRIQHRFMLLLDWTHYRLHEQNICSLCIGHMWWIRLFRTQSLFLRFMIGKILNSMNLVRSAVILNIRIFVFVIFFFFLLSAIPHTVHLIFCVFLVVFVLFRSVAYCHRTKRNKICFWSTHTETFQINVENIFGLQVHLVLLSSVVFA